MDPVQLLELGMVLFWDDKTYLEMHVVGWIDMQRQKVVVVSFCTWKEKHQFEPAGLQALDSIGKCSPIKWWG